MTTYSYMIGSAMNNLKNVEALDTSLPAKHKNVAPRGLFVEPWSVYRTAANGLEVGDGFPRCKWVWDAMYQDQLDDMLAYLSGAQSAVVYIRTRKDDRTYKYYKCVMHRPKPDEMRRIFGGIGLEGSFWDPQSDEFG